MSVEGLFLAQQQKGTRDLLGDVSGDQFDLMKKVGLTSGLGSLVGGGAGFLAAMAMGLNPATLAGAAGYGLLTGGASYGGGQIAKYFSGGTKEVDLGQNVDVRTGEKKHFSSSIKDKYQGDIDRWKRNVNNAILTKAVGSGMKAAMFAGFNPSKVAGWSDAVRGQFGAPSAFTTPLEASLPALEGSLGLGKADPSTIARPQGLRLNPVATPQRLGAGINPAPTASTSQLAATPANAPLNQQLQSMATQSFGAPKPSPFPSPVAGTGYRGFGLNQNTPMQPNNLLNIANVPPVSTGIAQPAVQAGSPVPVGSAEAPLSYPGIHTAVKARDAGDANAQQWINAGLKLANGDWNKANEIWGSPEFMKLLTGV